MLVFRKPLSLEINNTTKQNNYFCASGSGLPVKYIVYLVVVAADLIFDLEFSNVCAVIEE